jgi:Tetracyclin repressor-like, C-terminal domain
VKILDAGIANGEFRVSDTHLTFLDVIGMISIAFHWPRDMVHLSREKICRHFAEQALRLVGYEGTLPFEDGVLKLAESGG